MKTERILIKPSHQAHKSMRLLCFKNSKIFNTANYYIRQSFFNGEITKWNMADKMVNFHHKNLYESIPNAASQAMIKKLGDDWKGFFAALKSYNKTPKKFKKRPKPPSYNKKSLKTFIHPFQSMQCIDGYIHFPKKMNINPIKVRCCDNQPIQEKNINKKIISEVRIVPHGECFWLEVIYDDSINGLNHKNVLLDKSRMLGIDLGINNLLTIVSNVPTLKPLLIKGKVIKSINQRYNKRKAYYQAKNNTAMINRISVKRFCQINDYFHKVSNQLLQYCLTNNIGRVVIGKNTQWKNEINIGKVNNQKFVFIPHNALIQKITYKLNNYGIDVKDNEESYTSKSDALACDHLPIYKEGESGKYRFKGKRIKRGLYRSSIGKLINADVNGAINILRKVIGDGFVKDLINKGFVFNPVTWQRAPSDEMKKTKLDCFSNLAFSSPLL